MAVPSGYSGAAAIYQVQLRTGESTLPTPTDILAFLNLGIEQVSSALSPLLLNAAYPTTPGQTTQTLAGDIQDIARVSWSTGPPTQSGSLVYALTQLEPMQFANAAAGVPGIGLGPPTLYCIIEDANSALTLQLFPGAMTGQLNVYYHARPTLWADTTSTSSTNVDSALQEAAIVWAAWKVAQSRGRYQLGQLFMTEYEQLIAAKMKEIRRRTVPRSGRVTDVTMLPFTSAPPWWR